MGASGVNRAWKIGKNRFFGIVDNLSVRNILLQLVDCEFLDRVTRRKIVILKRTFSSSMS